MASITLQELFDKLDKSVEDIRSKTSMQDIGNALAEIIRVRTRLGYGVTGTGARRQKLKPLSLLYKEFRRQNRQLLSPQATVNRSNLTFTGEMLDSLKAKANKDGEVVVEPTGVRPEGLRNLTLARYVTERGRPFLFASDNELKQLARIIENGLNQSLRRRLGP